MLRQLTYLFFLSVLLTACGSGSTGEQTDEASRIPPSSEEGAPEPGAAADVTGSLEGADYSGIPGSDIPVERVITPGHRRYVYPGYRVEVRDREGTGERITIYVKKGDAETVRYDHREDATYFAGLSASNLILDQGTGAGLRTAIVLDLTAKGEPALRFKSAYHAEKLAIENGKLTFYALLPGAGEECRLQEGQTGRRFDEFQYDLASGEAQPTGKKKCLYQE